MAIFWDPVPHTLLIFHYFLYYRNRYSGGARHWIELKRGKKNYLSRGFPLPLEI